MMDIVCLYNWKHCAYSSNSMLKPQSRLMYCINYLLVVSHKLANTSSQCFLISFSSLFSATSGSYKCVRGSGSSRSSIVSWSCSIDAGCSCWGCNYCRCSAGDSVSGCISDVWSASSTCTRTSWSSIVAAGKYLGTTVSMAAGGYTVKSSFKICLSTCTCTLEHGLVGVVDGASVLPRSVASHCFLIGFSNLI